METEPRSPTSDEETIVRRAFRDDHPFASESVVQAFPIGVLDDFETGGDSYDGRIALVVDAGGDDSAVLLSDALDESNDGPSDDSITAGAA